MQKWPALERIWNSPPERMSPPMLLALVPSLRSRNGKTHCEATSVVSWQLFVNDQANAWRKLSRATLKTFGGRGNILVRCPLALLAAKQDPDIGGRRERFTDQGVLETVRTRDLNIDARRSFGVMRKWGLLRRAMKLAEDVLDRSKKGASIAFANLPDRIQSFI